MQPALHATPFPTFYCLLSRYDYPCQIKIRLKENETHSAKHFWKLIYEVTTLKDHKDFHKLDEPISSYLKGKVIVPAYQES